MAEYVSLHNYTCYSIMRSINRPKTLMAKAAADGVKSVAVTDYCTFAGIWESYKASGNVKLIVGCSMNFTDDRSPVFDFNEGRSSKPDIQHKSIILIASNAAGYRNLLLLNFEAEKCKLDKSSKIDKISLIDWELLEKYNEGVICLTSDSSGIISSDLIHGNKDKAVKDADRLKGIFGDRFALELQPNNRRGSGLDQFAANRALYNLSREMGIKAVAASGCLYPSSGTSDMEDQDFLLAMKNHRAYYSARQKIASDSFYLHSGDDIVKFFSRNFDADFAHELCLNTLVFDEMCERPDWIRPDFVTGDKVQLPSFPVRDECSYGDFVKWSESRPDISGLPEDDRYMRCWCEGNWENVVPHGMDAEYKERYFKELSVYEALGFSSYMLITADFLKWARNNDVRVGPGRGSVGGSLVARLLHIHETDPIQHGLIFERFLNMEKKELPDIDNDFDSSGREKVLKYVSAKYGEQSLAHVSNFVTFTPKNAITDVISCLEIGGSRSDAFKVAKNITETIADAANTIESAIESSPLFSEFVDEHPKVAKFARMLIGLPRSYSTHAAGIVIGKHRLPGLVPLRYDDHGNVALEFEKKRTEENGLVKVDMLGIENLNMITNTRSIISSLNLPLPPDPMDYDAKHAEMYEMISKGDTFGVFQLGKSGGTIDLCRKIKPVNLEDLAVINALTRPGVSPEVRESYVKRRNGKEPVEMPHPNLQKAVGATMGYPIFEECFMFVARDFCGWDLQRADGMRKISKLKEKGKHLLDLLHKDFVDSAVEHSKVDAEFAEKLWTEWVVPLSGYAFNKSHAITYSMLSLQTAFLKCYHASAFLAAKLVSSTNSNSPNAKEDIVKAKNELRRNGVKIVPPNINRSTSTYTLCDPKTLITGFCSMKGIKGPAAENIAKNQPFTSLDDFLSRSDSFLVKAPVVEALAACGALDGFGYSRKSMCLYSADLRKKLKTWAAKGKKFEYALPDEEWTAGQLRALETMLIGEALTGTKKDSFPRLFKDGRYTVAVMDQMEDNEYVVVELEVVDMFTFKVKKKESSIFGQEVCKLSCEDVSGAFVGMVLFPSALESFKAIYENIFGSMLKMKAGFGIRAKAKTNRYNGELSLVAQEIFDIAKPVPVPPEMDGKPDRRTVTLYSGSRKKLQKHTVDDFVDDLLSISATSDD